MEKKEKKFFFSLFTSLYSCSANAKENKTLTRVSQRGLEEKEISVERGKPQQTLVCKGKSLRSILFLIFMLAQYMLFLRLIVGVRNSVLLLLHNFMG
jgi:hypothetical protein